MDTSLPSHIAEQLKGPFQKLHSAENFGNAVSDISNAICQGHLSKITLEEILLQHGISNIEDLKFEILDMLLAYVNLILDDNYITAKEAESIKYLKLFFKIKEGDFYNKKYYEIERILDRQFENMYQNNVIDNEEALQKVELQELFDLSYDQFLELSIKAVKGAIKRGANPIDLDTFIKANS